MPITEEHKKESLSKAFVTAVVAKAGCIVKTSDHDYGVDLTIAEVQNLPRLNGKGIRYFEGNELRFQLKCTKNISISEEFVIYDLDIDNYNDLVNPECIPPKFLVLLHVEDDFNESIVVNNDHMILKKTCYWANLSGQEKSSNKNSVRIKIPSHQRLTSESLCELFCKFKRGEI